jgi:hypothetical protein
VDTIPVVLDGAAPARSAHCLLLLITLLLLIITLSDLHWALGVRTCQALGLGGTADHVGVGCNGGLHCSNKIAGNRKQQHQHPAAAPTLASTPAAAAVGETTQML